MKTNNTPNQFRSSDSENGVGVRNDNLENRGVCYSERLDSKTISEIFWLQLMKNRFEDYVNTRCPFERKAA